MCFILCFAFVSFLGRELWGLFGLLALICHDDGSCLGNVGPVGKAGQSEGVTWVVLRFLQIGFVWLWDWDGGRVSLRFVFFH